MEPIDSVVMTWKAQQANNENASYGNAPGNDRLCLIHPGDAPTAAGHLKVSTDSPVFTLEIYGDWDSSLSNQPFGIFSPTTNTTLNNIHAVDKAYHYWFPPLTLHKHSPTGFSYRPQFERSSFIFTEFCRAGTAFADITFTFSPTDRISQLTLIIPNLHVLFSSHLPSLQEINQQIMKMAFDKLQPLHKHIQDDITCEISSHLNTSFATASPIQSVAWSTQMSFVFSNPISFDDANDLIITVRSILSLWGGSPIEIQNAFITDAISGVSVEYYNSEWWQPCEPGNAPDFILAYNTITPARLAVACAAYYTLPSPGTKAVADIARVILKDIDPLPIRTHEYCLSNLMYGTEALIAYRRSSATPPERKRSDKLILTQIAKELGHEPIYGDLVGKFISQIIRWRTLRYGHREDLRHSSRQPNHQTTLSLTPLLRIYLAELLQDYILNLLGLPYPPPYRPPHSEQLKSAFRQLMSQ